MERVLKVSATALKMAGGHLGQRERVLYSTWALTFLWGVLDHYKFSAGESALTLLLTASVGVIGSYTYRASTAGSTSVGVSTETTTTIQKTPEPATDP